MVVICISASMSAKAVVHIEHGWNVMIISVETISQSKIHTACTDTTYGCSSVRTRARARVHPYLVADRIKWQTQPLFNKTKLEMQTCQPWPGKNLGNLKLPVAKTWRLVSKTWRSRPTIVGERTVSQGPSHYVNRTT